RIAREIEPRFAAATAQRPFARLALAGDGLLVAADLLEVAVLVRAHHLPGPGAALRLALDLHHLRDRLHARAQRGMAALVLEGRALGILDREDVAVAQVGIVGDREDVAARDVRLAFPLEQLALELRIRLVGTPGGNS